MDDSPLAGKLSTDGPMHHHQHQQQQQQTVTTPRPAFATPPLSSSSPASSSARPSSAAGDSVSVTSSSAASSVPAPPPPAPPSEAPSADDALGPSASVSVASFSSRAAGGADASSLALDDECDGRSSVAATSSSVAGGGGGGGASARSSSVSVATRDDGSSSSVAGGVSTTASSSSTGGRPPVDMQLVEALSGKDRLYVLSVAQDMEALFGNPSRASLSYSPSTSFHRRIVYQCAAYLGLQTATGEAKAIVVRLPVELYALTSAPYRVIDIAPAPPQPSTSVANQPPSGFRLMRRDPAMSLPASRGASPGGIGGGGDDAAESGRKKTYEQRQAEYDAARTKIFSASTTTAGPPSSAADPGGERKNSAGSSRRLNGESSGRGSSAERRTGRSRASSRASSTDSVPVVFVEPPPSSSSSNAFIYQSAAQQQYSLPLRPSAPMFDPSLPTPAHNAHPSASSFSPVYPSVGQHPAPASKAGSSSSAASSRGGGGGYRARNVRPPASSTSFAHPTNSYTASSAASNPSYAGSSRGGFQGYGNQPRLYEPSSSGSARRPPAGYTASDWTVTQPPPPQAIPQQQQQQPAMVPAQRYYPQQPLSGQAYMFIPFEQAGGYVAQPAGYGQQMFMPQQQQHHAQQGFPATGQASGAAYSSHSYPATPSHSSPSITSSSSPYMAGAPSPFYTSGPAPGQPPQAGVYGQYRTDGASSAPPFLNGTHHHGQAAPPPQPLMTFPAASYTTYGVAQPPQVVVPQPQHYPSDSAALSGQWVMRPPAYHRSDSSVSSSTGNGGAGGGGEGSSRPHSRGSSSSRLSFGASSGLSSIRQPAWGSDVGTTGTAGSRQSWASTSNAGTTQSGRSGRRRSSGAGTDRPSSPASTTSSVSRTRGLSQLAHIPPPKDHPLPPRPDWSVGNQQFDIKRPEGSHSRTPPRFTSTNDFPPLAGMGAGGSAQLPTSPQASEGIWSGGRGRAAVLRATPNGEVEHLDPSSPDRTARTRQATATGASTLLPGMPTRTSDPISVQSVDVHLPRLLTEEEDDDDDFEPRRPIARSSAALFDPSPALTLVSGSNGRGAQRGEEASAPSFLPDAERAQIEDRLASINLGLSAGEQGASVIGPPAGGAANGAVGLTYSSIVRRV